MKKKKVLPIDFTEQSFVLSNGTEEIKFKNIYEFTETTKISGTVALDMLKNRCLTFKNWIFIKKY